MLVCVWNRARLLESRPILEPRAHDACAPPDFPARSVVSFPSMPPQREAVRYCDGPLLVLAGAGSGKTRVITAKIAHLIERGADPAHIVAITFTNKAAREMRERAQALLDKAGQGRRRRARSRSPPSTRSASRILRSEAQGGGLAPGFSIFDPARSREHRRRARRHGRSRARARRAVEDQRVEERAGDAGGGAVAGGAERRRARRGARLLQLRRGARAYRAVDFDDLIVRPLALLESDAEAAQRWRERCAHVLVDEYQDTNPAQYRCCARWRASATPFTAVGDDDQAIYGWRGATLDNLAAAAARLSRTSRSSSSSRTTARPCASCARPTR